MEFYIGSFRPFSWDEVKHLSDYRDVKTVSPGDIVEVFGHLCQWDEDCVPAELCESWRQTGDPICDAALREVFTHPSTSVGKDLLQCLRDHAASGRPDTQATGTFLNEVTQVPPPGLLVTGREVAIAQEFFLDDSIQIMQALLHYSLAGGLASSRIVRTLEAVSYLLPHVKKAEALSQASDLDQVVSLISPESTQRTFVRLVETMQFVLDVMGCSVSGLQPKTARSSEAQDEHLLDLLPGGEGWKSAVRVRLLHGVARWRVQERWNKTMLGQADNVPISQEELAATLASFSTIPIWCLDRLNLPPSPEKTSAYLALWRHIGYYMGVSPSILLRYFSTPKTADKFVASAALNLFLEDPSSLSPSREGGDASDRKQAATASLLSRPTIPILVAVSNRPPLHTSLAYNIALTTHLLGRPLAAHLGLPPTSLGTRLRMHALLLAQRVPHYFARWYPRRAWAEKRRAVLAEGMVRSVRWNMGMRRTAFRPRTGVHTETEAAAEKEGGGELAPGVVEEEGVRPDPARAKALTRMWKEVLYEMVGVCAALGVLSGVIGYLGIRYVLRSL